MSLKRQFLGELLTLLKCEESARAVLAAAEATSKEFLKNESASTFQNLRLQFAAKKRELIAKILRETPSAFRRKTFLPEYLLMAAKVQLAAQGLEERERQLRSERNARRTIEGMRYQQGVEKIQSRYTNLIAQLLNEFEGAKTTLVDQCDEQIRKKENEHDVQLKRLATAHDRGCQTIDAEEVRALAPADAQARRDQSALEEKSRLELSIFESERARLTEFRARYLQEVKQLRTEFDEERFRLERAREDEIRGEEDGLRTGLRGLADKHQENIRKAEGDESQALAEAETEATRERNALEERKRIEFSTLETERQQLHVELARLSTLLEAHPIRSLQQRLVRAFQITLGAQPLGEQAWTNTGWFPFRSENVFPQRGALRIGLRATNIGGTSTRIPVEIPVFMPFWGQSHLWLHFTERERELTMHLSISLIVRAIAMLPPGTVRILLYDPRDMGLPFKLLPQRLPAEVFQSYATSDNLEFALKEPLSKADDVMRALHGHPSVFSACANGVSIHRPLILVVLKDYEPSAYRTVIPRLVQLASAGPVLGVHFFGIQVEGRSNKRETDSPDPTSVGSHTHLWLTPELYEKNLGRAVGSAEVKSRQAHYVMTDRSRYREVSDGSHSLVIGEPLPSEGLCDQVLLKLGHDIIAPAHLETEFVKTLPRPGQFCAEDGSDALETMIGYGPTNEPVYVRLDTDQSVHILIRGQAGSGKSTVLHRIIVGLASRYSPSEFNLILLDDKGGAEFDRYKTLLPHLTHLKMEKDHTFAVAILRFLEKELNRRIKAVRESGVTDIRGYRAKGLPMPRLVIVWDEAYQIFKPENPIADQAIGILDQLVKQGRFVGIHVIIATHDLKGITLQLDSITPQFGVVINLFSKDLSVDDDIDFVISQATRPRNRFEAQVKTPPRLEGGEVVSSIERIRFLNFDAKREGQEWVTLEKRLRDAFIPYPSPNPKISMANTLTDPRNHRATIQARLEDTAVNGSMRLWLGESISEISPPLNAEFQRQEGNNLLYVGRRDLLERHFDSQIAYCGRPELKRFVSASIVGPLGYKPKESIKRSEDLQYSETLIDAISDHVDKGSKTTHLIFVADFEAYSDVADASQELIQLIHSGPSKGVHVVALHCVRPGDVPKLPDELISLFRYRVLTDFDIRTLQDFTNAEWTQRVGSERALFFDSHINKTVIFAPYDTQQPIF